MTGGRALAFVLVGLGVLLGHGWAAPPPARGVDPGVVQRGRMVYVAQCVVCHGVEGDGGGMAAHMLRVQPRDFRRGVFKFRSTPSGALPTDDDLLRTVTDGVRWTGMVGRPDLPEADRWAVVHYVKSFSGRFAAEGPPSSPVLPPAPERSEALVETGRAVYREAECARCHGEQARGGGPSAVGLKDDWGWPSWPSDLTWRPLKRGSSAGGLYLTIATGLGGTPMPSYGDALRGDQIWALVYYLESLVPPAHRLPASEALGEEPRGWMALRMGRMMGPGGMMH
jgi:cytochrome c oxidase cbb3-type subunit 2